MTSTPVAPEPDVKNWTWVLDESCPECGFDASAITGPDVPGVVRDGLPRWAEALGRDSAAQRPAPEVWSATEYACHVRDVCARFAARADSMLTTDDPLFENWDQDVTAIEQRYWEQVPAIVSAELAGRAKSIADLFDGVQGADWQRVGRRSDGAMFTVDSLARYFLHDYVHHLWDVHA